MIKPFIRYLILPLVVVFSCLRRDANPRANTDRDAAPNGDAATHTYTYTHSQVPRAFVS